MDLGGAVKLIAAAEQAGIRRYVMVSTIRADPNHPGDDTFSVYLRAKGEADAELAASGLEYTIVRPGGLTDEPGTGRVKLGDDVGSGEIPRDDVAAVLAAVPARARHDRQDVRAHLRRRADRPGPALAGRGASAAPRPNVRQSRTRRRRMLRLELSECEPSSTFTTTR